jgi:hypothetical protein
MGATCRDGRIELDEDNWFDPKHGPLPEFWGNRHLEKTRTGIEPITQIYRCAAGSCLVNGTNRQYPACGEGRNGRLCAECGDGYFATNNLQCKPCPKGLEAVQIAGVLVFLSVALTCAMRTKERLQKKHPRLLASIVEKLPEVMKLVTGLLQILGAFAATLYRVPWPAAFSAVSNFFGILTLDMLALPSLRCSSYGATAYDRFDLHMTTMLATTACFVALLAYSYSRHNARHMYLSRTLVWNILLPFLFLVYPSISKTVLLMLRCREIDGTRYLLSDIALSCEDEQYAQYFRFALFGVLMFPVGIVALFTGLVHRQRRNLPPDWWPKEEPSKQKEAYASYRKEVGRSMAKPFAAWKSTVWDEKMAPHVKCFNRYGFLFAAYTTRFWWFEGLITVYKLCMTVVIVFVSDLDQAKILFGMTGATLMLGAMSFYQPFKHAGILSINTMAQLVILFVLFTASYLLINGGNNTFVAIFLVMLTIAPLFAGVVLTMRLPSDAIVAAADDLLLNHAQSAAKNKAAKGKWKPSGLRTASGGGSEFEMTGMGEPMRESMRRTISSDGSQRSLSTGSDGISIGDTFPGSEYSETVDGEQFAFANPLRRTKSNKQRQEAALVNPMHAGNRTPSKQRQPKPHDKAEPSMDAAAIPSPPALAPFDRQLSLPRGPMHLSHDFSQSVTVGENDEGETEL